MITAIAESIYLVGQIPIWAYTCRRICYLLRTDQFTNCRTHLNLILDLNLLAGDISLWRIWSLLFMEDGPLALNSSDQVYQVLLRFRIRIVLSLISGEAVNSLCS